ncbi:hypothetical protein [Pseudoalteromonas sp. ZZD1]|uniref:hypothetical protein n=1 Tax=Pseudoalteromonas sp. ZZD1 TaxID=3139395 RepID=UPI003BA9C5E0
MIKNIFLVLLVLFLVACQPQAKTTITNSKKALPTDTLKADISVQGYTSTLNNIDIKFLGKTVPYTYSEGKIGNSRGYNWWISKHFALKSDLPKEKVRLYLELLEMAYPHYVALFGMEPPNIERQRIAVVYGSSRARVREAMLDDGFLRGVHKTAGGETMFYNRAGYNFPSHRKHHQRYIVIHETMHAFHMALNGHSTWAPNWITEGLADSVAHHVYDPSRKQLTVMVFDRAPMNYIETGLKQYYSANKPTIEQINDDPALKRGLNFFIVHYLLSSPERAQFFAYFVQQLRLANPHSEATLSTANSLLKQTFKDWQAIEKGFAEFVQNIQPSFHIVSGPWEQDGAAYWLRNTDSNSLSRLDINPTKTPTHPVMDFPAPTPSELINTLDENQVAVLINLIPSQIHRSEVGIALQAKRSNHNQQYRARFIGKEKINDDQLLKFLIVDGERLHISAQNIDDYTSLQVGLTPEIRAALIANSSLGIKLSLEATQLKITLTAQKNSLIEQQVTLSTASSLMAALSPRKISLLSKNNNHLITPYLYNSKLSDNKSSTNAGVTNPWLFKNYNLLSRLFKTCQQHVLQLAGCESELSSLMTKVPKPNQHTTINTELNLIFNDYIKRLGDSGFKTLSGIDSNSYFNKKTAFLRVFNPTDFELKITANVQFFDHTGQVISTKKISNVLNNGTHNINLTHVPGAKSFQIEQQLQWQSLSYQSTLHESSTPFNGVDMQYEYSKNSKENAVLDITLTGPYSGKTQGKLTLSATSDSQPLAIKTLQKTVKIAPYKSKTYHFEVPMSTELTRLAMTAQLDVDGEAIRIVKYVDLTQ